MSFSNVIGLQQSITVLQRAMYSQRVAHAYLFHGPPNVGKTYVAHEFAKAVNCDARLTFASAAEADPCDQCSACTRIDRDAHPDVHALRPLAKVQTEEDGAKADMVIEGSMITTDQVADLISEVSLKATQARRKMFIVSSAESMNPAAANRLLKTLEEPPGATTLILTTQNLSRLLPTIISRCQMVPFRPAPLPEAEVALAGRFPAIEQGVIRSVVALSGGRIGWALRLLEHPGALELRGKLLDDIASLPGRDWFEGMAVGERLIEAAEDWLMATEDEEFAERALKASRDRTLRTKMNDVLDILLTWFRDLSVLAAEGDASLVINADRLEQLQQIAAERRPDRCRRACEDIELTRKHLRGNANLRLAAEVLALKLIGACR